MTDSATSYATEQESERRTCAHCGKELLGNRNSWYCGNECVTKAYWARQRDSLNAQHEVGVQQQHDAPSRR